MSTMEGRQVNRKQVNLRGARRAIFAVVHNTVGGFAHN